MSEQRDPTLQIKAWIANNEVIMKFWETTMKSPHLSHLQGQTQVEARELYIYYKGRYELALGFEQFMEQ